MQENGRAVKCAGRESGSGRIPRGFQQRASNAVMLQVIRTETRLLCYSGKHTRTYLSTIMKSEHIIRPSRP